MWQKSNCLPLHLHQQYWMILRKFSCWNWGWNLGVNTGYARLWAKHQTSGSTTWIFIHSTKRREKTGFARCRVVGCSQEVNITKGTSQASNHTCFTSISPKSGEHNSSGEGADQMFGRNREGGQHHEDRKWESQAQSGRVGTASRNLWDDLIQED